MITSWSHNVQRKKRGLLKKGKMFPRTTSPPLPHLLGHNWISCPFMKQLLVYMMEQVLRSQRQREMRVKDDSGFKPKWLWYIRRGEVVEGKMMISVIVLLIWDIKEVSWWGYSASENMRLEFRKKIKVGDIHRMSSAERK